MRAMFLMTGVEEVPMSTNGVRRLDERVDVLEELVDGINRVVYLANVLRSGASHAVNSVSPPGGETARMFRIPDHSCGGDFVYTDVRDDAVFAAEANVASSSTAPSANPWGGAVGYDS